MGGVICGDDVQTIVIQGLQQGLTIFFGFDGRIPLDEVPFGVVGLIVEPKMMNAYFSGDMFLSAGTLIQ